MNKYKVLRITQIIAAIIVVLCVCLVIKSKTPEASIIIVGVEIIIGIVLLRVTDLLFKIKAS